MKKTIPTSWQWQFPPCEQWTPRELKSRSDQVAAIKRETFEMSDAGWEFSCGKTGPYNYIEELMDVIHACETALREFPVEVLDDVKREVIAKNNDRGYYGGKS